MSSPQQPLWFTPPGWQPPSKIIIKSDPEPADSDKPTPILPPPLTDAEREDRPTLAEDFCECAAWFRYTGKEHSCPKCKNSNPATIKQHVIELMEEAGTYAANNGNAALSRELFDSADVVRRSWR